MAASSDLRPLVQPPLWWRTIGRGPRPARAVQRSIKLTVGSFGRGEKVLRFSLQGIRQPP